MKSTTICSCWQSTDLSKQLRSGCALLTNASLRRSPPVRDCFTDIEPVEVRERAHLGFVVFGWLSTWQRGEAHWSRLNQSFDDSWATATISACSLRRSIPKREPLSAIFLKDSLMLA